MRKLRYVINVFNVSLKNMAHGAPLFEVNISTYYKNSSSLSGTPHSLIGLYEEVL